MSNSEESNDSSWSDLPGLIRAAVDKKGPVAVLSVLVGADILKTALASRAITLENHDMLAKWLASSTNQTYQFFTQLPDVPTATMASGDAAPVVAATSD